MDPFAAAREAAKRTASRSEARRLALRDFRRSTRARVKNQAKPHHPNVWAPPSEIWGSPPKAERDEEPQAETPTPEEPRAVMAEEPRIEMSEEIPEEPRDDPPEAPAAVRLVSDVTTGSDPPAVASERRSEFLSDTYLGSELASQPLDANSGDEWEPLTPPSKPVFPDDEDDGLPADLVPADLVPTDPVPTDLALVAAPRWTDDHFAELRLLPDVEIYRTYARSRLFGSRERVSATS